MVVAETEGGTVMAARQLKQYSKEREGKRIRWDHETVD
jgi:hypothetical protein